MTQVIGMAVVDDKGTVSDIAAELYWKRFEDGRARARLELTEPPRQSGTIVLMTERETEAEDEAREPEVLLYKPGERRDRLISVSALSGEMLGTDFSYEDFAHFQGTKSDVNIERLADLEIDGRTLIVLSTTPKDPEAAFDRGSTYTRIETHFDREQCVPLRTRFFEEDAAPRKELIAVPDEIRQLGNRWIPYRVVMHDYAEDSKTIMTIDEIEFEPKLRDSLFDSSSLKRGR